MTLSNKSYLDLANAGGESVCVYVPDWAVVKTFAGCAHCPSQENFVNLRTIYTNYEATI